MMDDKTRDDLARSIRAILYERDQAGNYVNWDGAPDNEKAFWREAAHAAYSAVRIKPSSFRDIKAAIPESRFRKEVFEAFEKSGIAEAFDQPTKTPAPGYD